MPYDYEINTHASCLAMAIEMRDANEARVETAQLIMALGGDASVADSPAVAPLYIAALLARRASE